MARITSLPARHPRTSRGVGWPFQSSLAPLFAWGAAAGLGVWLGVVSPDLVATDFAAPDTDAPADVASLDAPAAAAAAAAAAADDDGGDDWSDMSGLAMGADWASEED